MKVILEFNLPEDDHDFKKHTYCQEVWIVLFQLDERIRRMLKHNAHNFKTSDEAFEKVRDMIREELDDKGVPFDLLW
jgi:hypothetical protein